MVQTGQGYTALERTSTRVFPHARDVGTAVAGRIAELIRSRQAEGRSCVLGLATGSTPVGVYNELVRLHREEGLSLHNVVTFNLDEYYPMQPHELQSYVRFMNEHLFDLIDIPPRQHPHPRRHDSPIEEVSSYCRRYEDAIAEAGGIDIQILGHRAHGAYRLQRTGFGQSTAARA